MSSKQKKVITRFPPSPTGRFHIGSARTALFNYLFAKNMGGKMLLRIEDTDLSRSKKSYEQDILKGLDALGIHWEGEMLRQSERTEVYKGYLERMIKNRRAYEAEQNKEGSGKVIRFKNLNKEVIFEDLVRGEIKFDTTELGDFIIARDISTPLYHMAVVVDDLESGVTHVIRGEDGISNTPRQILIQDALGVQRPRYAHIPLILAPDRSKMSKRSGATAIGDYLAKGYLPEALVNFLALMGWSAGDDKELYTMSELISAFDLAKVHRGGAIFNEEKLRWFNREYIKKFSDKEFLQGILEFVPDYMAVEQATWEKLLIDLRERIYVYSDIADMCGAGDFNWLIEVGKYDTQKLVWKNSTREETVKHLNLVVGLLSGVEEVDWNVENIKNAIWDYAEKEGRGDVLWPLRFALTGKDKSPDPFTVAYVLGKEEVLKRVQNGVEALT